MLKPATTSHHDLLAEIQLLRELSTRTQEELQQLRRQVSGTQRKRRSPRLRLFGIALMALLIATTPLSLFAANFVDLNPGSGHNANINAVAEAGITKGCFDTAHYCPNDFVTREQMASFLARTAGLGANPPVANALTAVTAQTATNAQTAGSITNQANSATIAATNANTANRIVLRDGNGNFSAGTITANLNGTASNATTATTANGVRSNASATSYAANELIRVAHVSGEHGFTFLVSDTLFPFGPTLTITAPKAGFVLVQGSVLFRYVQDANPLNDCPCNAIAFIRHEETGNTSRDFGPSVGGNEYASAPLTSVFQVSAGVNTFRVMAGRTGTTARFTAEYLELTGIFVPFNSTGGNP